MKIHEITKKIIDSANISGQKLVIIIDNKHNEIGKAFFENARNICQVEIFNLDDFGKRPLQTLPMGLFEKAKIADLLLILISKNSGENIDELITIRRPLIALKKKNTNLRVGQLLDISKEQFEEIFDYSPNKIKQLNEKIFSLIKKSKQVRIETSAGTKFICKISKSTKWINQDADLRRVNLSHSLLAGEVYGVPENCNGKLVVNGVLGGKFMRFNLSNAPLIINIENSLIKKVSSSNKELEKEFLEHLKKYENADRVGELGFGTNISLKKFYGVLGIDEKFPGNHIAFGHPYSEKTGAKWSSETHIDAVLKNCSTWIDNVQVLKDGKYLI